MKNVGIIGVLLLVLGLLSFIVAVPRSENQGVKIGDTKIGLQTLSCLSWKWRTPLVR
jgi:hypothetical protein